MVGNVIQIVTEKLSSLPFIEGIVLGGSRARGTHTENSDIDIGISLNTSFISIIIFSLNINYLHLYLIGVLVLSIHFFVRRYNQHHGTAHFILHPRNIHHVFRRLRLHNMIYYKTI